MQPQQTSPTISGDSAAARPLRPLLPAASPRVEAPPSQPKRARVSLACAACRSRKTKCNGDRPSCSECTSRDSVCQYTETENTQSKRKHQDLEELFEMLKSLPDEEASEILARIRAGVDPRDIVDSVKHGNMLVQFAATFGESRGSVSSEVDGGSVGGSGDLSGEMQEPGMDADSPSKQNS